MNNFLRYQTRMLKPKAKKKIIITPRVICNNCNNIACSLAVLSYTQAANLIPNGNMQNGTDKGEY